MWLVTGATGHIGNVLVRKLIQRGERVRALVLPNECRAPIQGLDIETIEGNVLDRESLTRSMNQVKGVFHLAGVISIMPGANELVRQVIVEGTKNIIRVAEEVKVGRFIYTSSIHAIQRVDQGVIDESLPYDPKNPYVAYDRAKAGGWRPQRADDWANRHPRVGSTSSSSVNQPSSLIEPSNPR